MGESDSPSAERHFPTSHRRAPRIGAALLSLLERVDALVDRLASSRFNPLYQTGPIVVLMLAILAATGVYLFLVYSVSAPYATLERIQDQVFAGRWIRALHRYSADASILFTIIHALRLLLQGRTWGPRALAWMSGTLMTALLLLSGWTGFILAWDVQAQVLALAGARVIDLVPLFPEPITSQFASDASLSNVFFFANLFAHVALPLGIVFLLWIHVARVARATLFPPRPLLIALCATLIVLSIVWPVTLDAPARLDRIPFDYSIDWVFQFWLPLADAPGTALALWVAVGAVVITAPWWWRPRQEERPQASTVNERLCEGCRQCHLDCPYEAIRMVPRTLGEGSEEVARVSPDLCVSCGVCAGSCDVFRVGPPGRTGKDQLISLRSLIDKRPVATGELVVFACTQSALRMRALLGTRDVRVVPVECAGSLHMYTVHAALRRGASGVVVWSCPPRNCQFREGAHWLSQRLTNNRKAALPEVADRARILHLDAGPGELKEALAAIDAFRATLSGATSPSPTPSRVGRRNLLGRVALAGTLAGGLGLLATTTTGAAPTTATVRLAWRHSVGLIERCRTPSAEELASLPMHMRRPKFCERRYPDLRAVVRLDGETRLDRIVEPGGVQKDRAPQLLFDVDVTPGTHTFAVDVTPVLSDAEARESGVQALHLLRTETIAAGEIWRVQWDRASNALEVVPPKPLPVP